ncbi:hypothetical protein BGZ95_003026 [Linnemannia exigua]|uniref:BHLH domain-containing protein n=1 Tax=Linnemannia exigua TaxID=604196 RepID=A0AAD4H9E7_9FUNG|nr:hypothetical protein BGZ95_003026 [Linnemannia exigua]
MNTASAGPAAHEGPTKRPGDDSMGARRGSIPDNHHYYNTNHGHHGHQGGSLTTPAPSPHGRPSSASPDHNHLIPSSASSYQQQRYSNGHPTSAPSPDHHLYKDQQYPPSSSSTAPPSQQLTPSPPLPSPADGFQGRPLPPIEPSHPLHSYMSNSRRGSVTDPDYHASSAPTDAHKRPSISAMDSSSFYNTNHNNGPGPGPGQDSSSRHYANSSPSSIASSTSEPHYPSYPHPSTSPMQLRQSEHISGRRESLPSIHSSAGPLGQLLAQEPQRRHSIAHGDQMMGPLKRKTSSTPLSQMHSSSELEHPAKRRDSIPDAAHPLHHHHQHHHHPYPPRSSFSAPSSPPRRGSNAMMHGPVPTLNLQPAAEIKSSMVPSSLHNGPSAMDHVRPHFPPHQPRRPSLLSEASLSRRSSVADNHHYPSHYQPSSSSSSHQDYDHNMDMDMERMHLHGGPSDHPQQGGPPSSGTAPLGPGGLPGSHLYPGYPGGENGHKGDTPYSRSPELRVSHKLAERKRRKEMKELFDELRDALPVDRSLKTSKWEILSKAVDYISGMRENQEVMSKEIDILRQEVARLKNL